MDTLRELGEFVGMGDATPAAVTGPPTRTAATIGAIRERLSSVLAGREGTSLRAIMEALPRLPSISLDIETNGNLADEVPIRVNFTVHPSGGVILSTVLQAFHDGHMQGSPMILLGPGFSTTSALVTEPDPGEYQVIVRRIGITATGVTPLEQTFNIFARAKPVPHPPAPPPSVPPGGPPPTTKTVHSQVFLLNCHDAKRTLDIHVRDLTLNQEFSLFAVLAAQYDQNGLCPAFGSTPVTIPLADKHWHEIVALDAELPGCLFNPGDAVDPLNANCWREHIVILGDKNGPAFQVIIA